MSFIERALRCDAGPADDGDADGAAEAAAAAEAEAAAAAAVAPCVLVHCEAGESRSVAVVAAYLMRAEGHTPEEAVRATPCQTRVRPVSFAQPQGAWLGLLASSAELGCVAVNRVTRLDSYPR